MNVVNLHNRPTLNEDLEKALASIDFATAKRAVLIVEGDQELDVFELGPEASTFHLAGLLSAANCILFGTIPVTEVEL